jgi:hypothetical protein
VKPLHHQSDIINADIRASNITNQRESTSPIATEMMRSSESHIISNLPSIEPKGIKYKQARVRQQLATSRSSSLVLKPYHGSSLHC